MTQKIVIRRFFRRRYADGRRRNSFGARSGFYRQRVINQKINEKLQLGAEIAGAVTSQFQLSKGQLQVQAGGNYNLRKTLTLDFGLIAGRFAASPRVGAQFGFSVDF